MNALNWILNLTIAILAAVNAVCWGYAIKELQDPSLTVDFVFRLVFNRFFIMAIAAAFTGSRLNNSGVHTNPWRTHHAEGVCRYSINRCWGDADRSEVAGI